MPDVAAQGFRLSPQQRYLWALAEAGGDSAFRGRCAVRIAGPLAAEGFLAAFRATVERHEILRTTFQPFSGLKGASQVVRERGGVAPVLLDLRHCGGREKAEAVERWFRSSAGEPFDLARGPLARCALVTLSPEEHLFLIDLSALCTDAVGLGNLVRELG